MRFALVVGFLAALIAGPAQASISSVEQIRRLYVLAEVHPDFLNPDTDVREFSNDDLNPFVLGTTAIVEYDSFGSAGATAEQDTEFSLTLDTAIAAGAGFSNAIVDITDTGFDSKSESAGVSQFEWVFLVDEATQYSLSGVLQAELASFLLRSPGPLSMLPGSLYELEDLSRSIVLHEGVAVDISADGNDVVERFDHEGELLPGTYKLTLSALTTGIGWENARASAATGFAFELILITSPEPSPHLAIATALLTLLTIRRRHR